MAFMQGHRAFLDPDLTPRLRTVLFVLENLMRTPGLLLLEFLCLAAQDYDEYLPEPTHFASGWARAALLLGLFALVRNAERRLYGSVS